jgi:hypothetical protein
MRGINLVSLILVIIGILIWIAAIYAPLGEGGGYIAIWFGWPLILIGIIIWVMGLFVKKK